MANFLFGWELGAGLGHAARIKPLAQAMHQRGHACTLVLRDLVQPAAILRELAALPRLQAPLWQHETRGLPQPQVSLPEVLLAQGYLLAPHLHALVEGWLAAFRLAGTEALVADYAPTAVLAARIAGIPSATVGIGFALPPDQRPLPSFRPELNVPQARLADGEARALASVNAVLAAHGRPPMARLWELFAGDRPLLCTWPELDHYGRAPEGLPWFGPSFLSDTGTGAPPPPWPAGSGPRVFAYLKAGHADHAQCLQALVQRGCRVICYLPEVAAGKPPPVRSALLHYATAPVSLGTLLPDCELLVCHAGEATMAQGLLAGVPLLLMPMQAEQALLARTTAACTGAAVNVLELPPGTPLSTAVERALGDAGLRERAQAFAARYRGYTQAGQTEALAAEFEGLLRR